MRGMTLRGGVGYSCITNAITNVQADSSIYSLCYYKMWLDARSVRHGRAAPVPCVHLLMSQGEHLLHGRDPCTSEALVVLTHFDGLQPLGHRPEHGAVTATGAGQADGHTVTRNMYLVSRVHFMMYV